MIIKLAIKLFDNYDLIIVRHPLLSFTELSDKKETMPYSDDVIESINSIKWLENTVQLEDSEHSVISDKSKYYERSLLSLVFQKERIDDKANLRNMVRVVNSNELH